MSSPVALVTGASSGIGLALSRYLVSKSWVVVCCDINPPPSPLPSSDDEEDLNYSQKTIFIKTDISNWDSQAAAFAEAFRWHNRLDFVALNAGIDDRDDIFASISSSPSSSSSSSANGGSNGTAGAAAVANGTKPQSPLPSPPRKPNMLTFEVNLYGTYYGVKLAAHYMSLNPTSTSFSSSISGGGKIVITSSAAGFYALPPIPQYTASKHALVGLVRSLAPLSGTSPHNITINSIAPAVVATGLAPPGLMDAFPEEARTPMSTILRAFDELGCLSEFATQEEGGKRDEWVKKGPNGQIVECSLGTLYYRDEIEKADDSQKFMSEGALDAWKSAYRERNKKFALQSNGL